MKTFDMRYFPYEVHAFELSTTSLYSTNVVNFTVFPTQANKFIPPKLPPGWDYIGTKCDTFIEATESTIEGDDRKNLEFANFRCLVFVSRNNTGWWTTSFLLHCGVIVIAFAGVVGIMSNGVAEARDDRDSARRALFEGTRLIGKYFIS